MYLERPVDYKGDGPIPKAIRPPALVRLLLRLPAGYFVMPNAMGNLGVLNELKEYVGYIDLGDETYEACE